MARHFENDMDEARTANIVEKNETAFENEDESDQAKASFFHECSVGFTLNFFANCIILKLICSITWKAMRSTI